MAKDAEEQEREARLLKGDGAALLRATLKTPADLREEMVLEDDDLWSDTLP
jgi:hypothetical protein